ncbi:MAG: hypothetical protein ACI841_002484 [Planctomycetota bacterium]|jgi:hypothetical protein
MFTSLVRRLVPLGLSFCCFASPFGALFAQGTVSEQAELKSGEFDFDLDASWGTLTDTVCNFESTFDWIRDLKPAADRASYDASAFRPLLTAAAVSVGDVWLVRVADALPFLHQLHPDAMEDLHHAGSFGLGGVGVLARARCQAR